MKKICIMSMIITAVAFGIAAALPGLEISVGPYIGTYNPSLKTLDEQVLLYDHQTVMGSAAIFGGQFKLGLPMGLGGGIDLGYWSNSKEWTDDAGDLNSYKVKLMPLDVFVQYSMPIVPAVLKGKAGASAGNVWASFDASQVRPNVWNHYWNTEGSANTFGIFGGLELVALPKFNFSAEVGYKMGEIEKLTIKECHEPGEINDVLEYYDHDKDQVLPLPLELNGTSFKIVATYVF
jgi:hypothetical protein